MGAAVAHRWAGLSVSTALTRARASITAPPESIFAAVCQSRPELHPQTLNPVVLSRISRAIEDECLARAKPGLLIGGFQRKRLYERAADRWVELAANMELTLVWADFAHLRVRRGAPCEIPIRPDSPLCREWMLIAAPGCVLARQRAGGGHGRGPRVFDAIWSPDPEVVHQAACAAVSLLDDQTLAQRALGVLGPPPSSTPPELRHAAALTNRIIGYLGTWGR